MQAKYEAKLEAKFLKIVSQVLNGRSVEHGRVLDGNALHDQLFAATFQFCLAVRIGQVKQSDCVLGHQGHFITIQVVQKGLQCDQIILYLAYPY